MPTRRLRAEKREHKKLKTKFAPKGATLGGQKRTMEVVKNYVGTIKKIKL